LVYCPKCGSENADDVLFCHNCSTRLKAMRYSRNRSSDEICFGGEKNSHIWGLIIGLLIIFWGLTTLFRDVFDWFTWNQVWPFFLVMIGFYVVYTNIKR